MAFRGCPFELAGRAIRICGFAPTFIIIKRPWQAIGMNVFFIVGWETSGCSVRAGLGPSPGWWWVECRLGVLASGGRVGTYSGPGCGRVVLLAVGGAVLLVGSGPGIFSCVAYHLLLPVMVVAVSGKSLRLASLCQRPCHRSAGHLWCRVVYIRSAECFPVARSAHTPQHLLNYACNVTANMCLQKTLL